MKMNLLRGCVAAGITSAALMPSVSQAFDGELAFYGSISDVTCNIDGAAPGAGNRKEVQLGDRIGTDTFTEIGKTSNPVTFNLNIGGNAGCTNGTKVLVEFDQRSININPVTGNLKLVGTKPAEGVEIQIMDAGNGKNGKIMLGQPQNIADAQVATVANNTATLSYAAQYVSTAAPAAIKTGSGNSFIRYVLAYH
ncbi:fimbrial protein [Burkholderia contaminans FFH2055]|uniref:fimbrial protein n=2 Tax=Burkholderiaceae TaxID=119060 RepID=UPI000625CE05|nr:fimbrial protein [Burkholderia contaminans]KKL38683.1 fimbrial protein [Burkholderia contaminans FFH2055]TCW71735.1 type 1 fimbrial protein [Burkholderia sp. SRS-25]AOL03823.1 fimbrial protein [Burkholderia contaminans]ELK6464578.1 type 1 fimbrial protein [Burkholderia contaminans]MCA7883315.1 type 1 fimbrial protein [Burkholderia contaminans]